MTRPHIVSLRFTDEEKSRLERRAAEDCITLSELLRRLILESWQLSPPSGESVGSGVRIVQDSNTGSWSTEGIVWFDGTVGGMVTIG